MNLHGIETRLKALAARLADPGDSLHRATTPELRARLCGALGLSPAELATENVGVLAAVRDELARRGAPVAGEAVQS